MLTVLPLHLLQSETKCGENRLAYEYATQSGLHLAWRLGDAVGANVGAAVGVTVGLADGPAVGVSVGEVARSWRNTRRSCWASSWLIRRRQRWTRTGFFRGGCGRDGRW